MKPITLLGEKKNNYPLTSFFLSQDSNERTEQIRKNMMEREKIGSDKIS